MYGTTTMSMVNSSRNSSSTLKELENLVSEVAQSQQPSSSQNKVQVSNNKNSPTSTIKEAPIWQTVAQIENLFFSPDQGPSTNPTSENENKKVRVNCKCPNCNVIGGNKTYNIYGRLQHICHIPGCGKVFDFPSILLSHLKKHDDNRPFHCSWYLCDKKFKSKEQFKRHITIHTGERNFYCPHCALGFLRADHLKQHIRTIHEGFKKKRYTNKKKQN